jgi:hypothetical protein
MIARGIYWDPSLTVMMKTGFLKQRDADVSSSTPRSRVWNPSHWQMKTKPAGGNNIVVHLKKKEQSLMSGRLCLESSNE